MVGAILVQATIMPVIGVSIFPDVALVMLLVWSALRGVQEGLVWAFGIGLLLDALALDPLGGNALALLPVVLLGGFASRRFFQSSLLVPVLATIAGTLLHAIILLLVRSASGGALPFDSVLRLIALQALLNVILVPAIYLVASMAHRQSGVRYA
jgi:rod shape-determining protein MreD